MSTNAISNQRIHCNICKRPVLDVEVNKDNGIAYCYGCDHYFPITSQAKRKRNEITIPDGTDTLRLRLLQQELEILIRWKKNVHLGRLMVNIGLTALPVYFLNRTEIKVTPRYIFIEHKPIDLIPPVFFNANYIEQLFVDEVDEKFWGAWPYPTLGLYAKLQNGEDKLLMWSLHKSTLLYIEQEIERILKIEDTV